MPIKGVELEVCDGITEHSSRVALKGVFQNFGDVVACWVPPIDRRGTDHASVRFGNPASAEAAKNACDAGQVFLQGLPVKVRWRVGGGRRVGNSDLGEIAGGNSPSRQQQQQQQVKEEIRPIRDIRRRGSSRRRSRSRGNSRRSRSRTRRSRSRGRGRSRSPRERTSGRRRSRSRSYDRDRGKESREIETRPAELPALPASAPSPIPELPWTQPAVVPAAPPTAPPAQAAFTGVAPAGLLPTQPSLPAPQPEVPVQTAAELESEARRKEDLANARAERAAKLKRGPGVAALVQEALKRARTQPSVPKRAEGTAEPEREKVIQVDKASEKIDDDSDEDSDELRQKQEREEQLEAERQREQAEREAREREEAEREAREKKEQAKREAAEAEQALQKKEAETREMRIKASVEAAKKQQAERAAAKAAKEAAAASDSLYANMPQPNLESETVLNEVRLKEAVTREKTTNLGQLPPEDRSKIVFLDVDGVLRPARAGGFDILSVDGDAAVRVDTSDFFPSAVKALRHIIERTGAHIVLSSEWRRSEALCSALTEIFEKNRMRPWGSMTTTALEPEPGPDPVRSFAERRAREITMWLRDHEGESSGWVVLDDINLAIADEARKASTKSMAPRLVQTWPLCGLTMGNAKTAVRILNGEMINKVVVERPMTPGAGPPPNTVATTATSGTTTPLPSGRK